MSSQMLQLAQLPRQCMSLAKFSSAITSDGYNGPIPWAHVSGEDGALFLVLESVGLDSSQPQSHNHRLRVLRDPNVLEELDLELLGEEARKAQDCAVMARRPGRSPAVVIVVQCPCIALKYPIETNQVKRFQIRLSNNEEYYEVMKVMSRARVPTIEASIMPNVKRVPVQQAISQADEQALAPTIRGPTPTAQTSQFVYSGNNSVTGLVVSMPAPKPSLRNPGAFTMVPEVEPARVVIPPPRELPFGSRSHPVKFAGNIDPRLQSTDSNNLLETFKPQPLMAEAQFSSTAPARMLSNGSKPGDHEKLTMPQFSSQLCQTNNDTRQAPTLSLTAYDQQAEIFDDHNHASTSPHQSMTDNMGQDKTSAYPNGETTNVSCNACEAAGVTCEPIGNGGRAPCRRCKKLKRACIKLCHNEQAGGKVSLTASKTQNQQRSKQKTKSSSLQPSRQSRRIRGSSPVELIGDINARIFKSTKFKHVDVSQADRYDLRSSSTQPQAQAVARREATKPGPDPSRNRSGRKKATIAKDVLMSEPAPTPEPLTPIRAEETQRYLALKKCPQKNIRNNRPEKKGTLNKPTADGNSSTATRSSSVPGDLDPIPPRKRRRTDALETETVDIKTQSVVIEQQPNNNLGGEDESERNSLNLKNSLAIDKQSIEMFNKLNHNDQEQQFDKFAADALHDDGFLQLCKTLNSMWQSRLFRF